MPGGELSPTCIRCGADDWYYPKPDGKGRRCRPCHAARARRHRYRRPAEAMFYGARRRAQYSGTTFDLVLSDVEAMVAGDRRCAYCGCVTMHRGGRQGGAPNSMTLDRILPDRGYTLGNVVLACHRCNSEKSGYTPQGLRAMATRIEAIMQQYRVA